MKKVINIHTREEVVGEGNEDVKDLLRQVSECNFVNGVYIGYEEDGSIAMLTTMMSPEQLLFLAKRIEMVAMTCDLEDYDD